MRLLIISCEIYKKEHSGEYVLPPNWVTTNQTVLSRIGDDEKHFCSKKCLIQWAKESIET